MQGLEYAGLAILFSLDSDELLRKNGPEVGFNALFLGASVKARGSRKQTTLKRPTLQSDIGILPQVLTDGNITSVLLSRKLL